MSLQKDFDKFKNSSKSFLFRCQLTEKCKILFYKRNLFSSNNYLPIQKLFNIDYQHISISRLILATFFFHLLMKCSIFGIQIIPVKSLEMLRLTMDFKKLFGRTIKYEQFEQLVFDPQLSDDLFNVYFKLLQRINADYPDRQLRINVIDSTQSIVANGGDAIEYNKPN